MDDRDNKHSSGIPDKHDGTFQTVFAWLTALSVSIAALAYLA